MKYKNLQKRKYNAGFTLLEVIISLAILTIALAGIITVGSNRAETLLELQQRSTAMIVANNVLNLYYRNPQARVGIIDGTQENGNLEWYWQIEVKSTNNNHIYRLDVKVSKDSNFDYSYAQLVGFKWH